MHDPTKVLLGSTGSSDKEVTCEPADPETFKAGLAVRKKSDGGLQLASDGTAVLIGVSLGPSLSDTKKTAVSRVGNYIPLLLKNDPASLTKGDLTFTAKLFGAAGNEISIEFLNTETAGGETVTVTDQKISVGMEGGVSTATQLKTAIDANEYAMALIKEVEIANGQDAVAQAAFAEDELESGTDVAALGAAVKIDSTSGEGSVDGDTTGATYLSGLLTGVYPDGTEAPCAMIALPGGF